MDLKKAMVCLCAGWMGAGAFAYTFFGPPTAELKKFENRREDKHGYIFSFTQMDLGVDGGGTLKDVKVTRHYYTWGVALDENFNFNVLLGAVAGEMDKSDIGLGATSDFDGDNGFSAGFNLKCTFHHGEKVDLGAMFQMTTFSTEDTVDGVDIELDNAYDIQVAVGPTVDMGGWKLYGGAFFYMLEGDLELSVPAFGFTVSTDIEEDDQFGGFIGAQFQFYENTDLIVEYAMGNDSYGFGASIGWRF